MIATTMNRPAAPGIAAHTSWYSSILRDVRFLDHYTAASALQGLFESVDRERPSDPNSSQWFTIVAIVAFVVARTAQSKDSGARRRLTAFLVENRDLLNVENG